MADPFLCPKCGRQCDQQHCPVCQAEFDEDWTVLDTAEDDGAESVDDGPDQK